MTYLDDLSRELAAHGLRGRTRRRILAEAEDHLSSDPHAEERFGAPTEVANAFAAELGAQAARRAAVNAFAALGVAGVVYAVCFLSLAFAEAPTEVFEPLLGTVALATMILAPQVAFVAGTLALARAIRRRREHVLPTRELNVVRRRTTVALTAGLASMAALSLYAYEFSDSLDGWWRSLAYSTTTGAAAVLVLAVVPLLAARRFRPRVPGDGGDVFDDLRLERFRDEPWRFAGLVAFAAGAAVWLAAALQGDPLDGLLNGVAEALACFAGFAALGRYLGLRR